jgi:hypothetical protein
MKNALFLTGAAARISQEVAIIDKLIEKHDLDINEENTVLAGFSSGALNIGAINACFRKKNALSWENDFKKELLFKIKTSDVFHLERFIPVNTGPLRNTINGFLEKAKIDSLENCSFTSFILAFSYRKLKTIWLSNFFNRHKYIDMLDLLMATSAIPIIFPDQKIRSHNEKLRRFVPGSFGDGGIGGSFRKFDYYMNRYMRENGSFDNIYIISPMREISSNDFEDMNRMLSTKKKFKIDLKEMRLLRLFLDMISQNGFDSFIKRFYKWSKKKDLANDIYICIPELTENFPFLNFDKQSEQYQAVADWADANPNQLTIPIEDYIKKFDNQSFKEIKNTIRRKIRHRLISLRIG